MNFYSFSLELVCISSLVVIGSISGLEISKKETRLLFEVSEMEIYFYVTWGKLFLLRWIYMCVLLHNEEREYHKITKSSDILNGILWQCPWFFKDVLVRGINHSQPAAVWKSTKGDL